jgi:hypothetical protein
MATPTSSLSRRKISHHTQFFSLQPRRASKTSRGLPHRTHSSSGEQELTLFEKLKRLRGAVARIGDGGISASPAAQPACRNLPAAGKTDDQASLEPYSGFDGTGPWVRETAAGLMRPPVS